MNLSRAFDQWVNDSPEAIALTDTSGRQWRREQLYVRLRRLGSALHDLGLQPGDRVAVLDGLTRRHIEAEYAIMMAGLVRVPLDPANRVADQVSTLVDSGARAIIFSPQYAQVVSTIASSLPRLLLVGDSGRLDYETMVKRASPMDGADLSDDAIAWLAYSGGTTGKPKAIIHTHGSLGAVIRNIHSVSPAEPGSVFLNVRSLWPTGAVITLARLLEGAHVVMESFSPDTFGELIRRHRARTTSLVPTQLIRYIDRAPNVKDCAALSTIDVGSSALPVRDFLHLTAQIGPRIGVPYGMTEAPWSTYLRPESMADEARRAERADSCGQPTQGVRVVIANEEGSTLSPGHTGEVLVAGDNVMRGYWKREDLTASVFRVSEGTRYYRTGDVGYVDHEGYLHIQGRKTDLIRTGGRTVVPAEVEAVILTHPGVSEAAVAGVPDREWGQMVCGFVVRRPDISVTEAEIIAYCRDRLPGYKTPKRIRLMDCLPRSTSYGKVLRKVLVEKSIE